MKRIITLLAICFCIGTLDAQNAAFKVRGDGNVGVNTNDPGFPFTVSVDASVAGVNAIILEATGTGAGAKFFQKVETGGYGQLFVRDNVNADRMFLNYGSNSFIMSAMSIGGTSSFGNTFHVTGTASKTGGGPWLAASDKRLKSNVQDYTGGLDEVMKIRPVTFEYNGKGNTKSGARAVGIIAQEMQKIAPYTVSEFSPEKVVITDDPEKGPSARMEKSAERYLQFDGNALTYMLINSVQEQQGMIEELRRENQELRDMINEIATQISTNNTNADLSIPGGQEGAFIEQNVPNPFKGQTTLDYFIPSNSTSAKIAIFASNGQLIRTVDVNEQGNGTLKLTASDIPSGNYHYSLMIDGQVVDTKTMSVIE